MSLRRSSLALSVAVMALACGAPPAAPPSASGPSPLVVGEVSTAPAVTKSCVELPSMPSAACAAGIDALISGRPTEAASRLAAAVRADPRDRAAEVLRVASLATLAEHQARAAEELTRVVPVTLEPIPLARTLQRTIEGVSTSKVHLEKVSEAKNLVTDSADWLKKNELEPSPGSLSELPGHVATTLFGRRPGATFVHPDHVAAVYGARIVVSSEGKRPILFDAAAAVESGPRPFEIDFAALADHTLIVGLAYNGYARESGGKNGYLAAFDATTGVLAWSSDPLVANARSALVRGGSIVTGYGFTAEPDFLFVVDLATGAIDQKVPLKSGPEAIRQKGDRLFVRSYDVDYVFRSTSELPSAPPAALAAADAQAQAPFGAEARCWLRRAAAAISARSASDLREATEGFAAASRDRPLARVLRDEERKLSTAGRIDVPAAPLVVLPAPPWQAAAPGASPAPSSPPPKLVSVGARSTSQPWKPGPRPGPDGAWFIAPIDGGRLPPGVRPDLPSSYGMETLGAVIPVKGSGEDDGRMILIYGGRYLALLRGDATERVFDLDAFRHPPKADPVWKEFAEQDATYAQEQDGVLYVCNGGGSYAKEVYGKKGFLSALDAATGQLLWRSAPLTCNASFAIVGDYIISGYGFTAEPDYVLLVRRSDGRVVQKVTVPSAPSTITVADRLVHVETYSGVVELELR